MVEALNRDFEMEETLCTAIQKHRVVRLKYADDAEWRIFRPQAVYWSTVDRINVTGIQTRNENDPSVTEAEVRNFVLAQIKDVQVTYEEFEFDATIDPTEERFANGIICIIHPMKLG